MIRRIFPNTLMAIVIAALLIPTLVPAVQAAGGAPSVQSTYPQQVDSPVLGIGLEATGKYAAVVVRSAPQSCTLGFCPRTGSADWYGIEFGDLPKFDGEEYGDKQAFANSSQLITVAAGDGVSVGSYFATAGPGNMLRFGQFSSFTFPWAKTLESSAEFKGIALSKNGDRLAVLTYSVTTGNSKVTVYETGGSTPGRVDWERTLDNEYGMALAVGRDSGALAVATNKNLYGFSINRAPSVEGKDYFRYGIGGHVVSDLKVSDSASATWIAAVTQGKITSSGQNSRLFYIQNTAAGFAAPQSATLLGRGLSVDINTDGSRVVAGTSSGRLYQFERSSGALASIDGSPRSIGTGAAVSHVDFDASGNYLVAAVGTILYGFHRDYPDAPIWLIQEFGGGKITQMDFAENARRIVVATDAPSVYAFDVKTRGKATADSAKVGRFVEPRERIDYEFTVSNTGNTVDKYDFNLRNIPAGWDIPEINSRTLIPGESVPMKYNVTTAAGAEPGPYFWDVEVFRRGDPTPTSTLRYWSNITHVAAIRVEANQRTFNLEPGDTQSFTYTISNNGNANALVNITASQELNPPGTEWGLTLERTQVIVKKGEPVRLTGGISVIDGVPKGVTNKITLNFEYNGLIRSTLPITVRISPDYRLGLTPDKTVLDVEAGSLGQVLFRITNNGNAEDIIVLSSSIGDSAQASKWSVTIPQDRVTVKPGEPKTVAVNFEPAKDASNTVITIQAQGAGEEPQKVSIRARVLAPPEDDGGLFTPSLSASWLVIGAIALALTVRRKRT